jgi:hypothetical protein
MIVSDDVNEDFCCEAGLILFRCGSLLWMTGTTLFVFSIRLIIAKTQMHQVLGKKKAFFRPYRLPALLLTVETFRFCIISHHICQDKKKKYEHL